MTVLLHFKASPAEFDYAELSINTDGETLPREVLESIDGVDGVLHLGKQLTRLMVKGASIMRVPARIVMSYDAQAVNHGITEIKFNGKQVYRSVDASSGVLRLIYERPQQPIAVAV